jgi:sulfatase modifying factor 1
VRITRAFCFGKTTVTQGQWWSVMGTRPWLGQDYVKEGADVAATYMSWDDAVEFCAWLTKFEQSSGTLHGNQQYRLPTEAEWEYACRAGTKTEWSFGDDDARLGEEFAWFDGNAWDKDEKYAHEVGQKKPNPWGLYDMQGNVAEWCSDWYDAEYYAKSPAADPQGPGAGSFRVIRGGGWDHDPVGCRSASRDFDAPTHRDKDIGFRVVLSVE